jgi:hypothetical protein
MPTPTTVIVVIILAVAVAYSVRVVRGFASTARESRLREEALVAQAVAFALAAQAEAEAEAAGVASVAGEPDSEAGRFTVSDDPDVLNVNDSDVPREPPTHEVLPHPEDAELTGQGPQVEESPKPAPRSVEEDMRAYFGDTVAAEADTRGR